MIALALLFIAAGAYALGWSTKGRPDPTPYRPATFDEHTATATALLQPDDPALPDRRPSFIEQVEAFLAAHAPKES